MITLNQIFNETTLNVFTDASVLHKETGETIGCPGALLVRTETINNITYNNIIDSNMTIIRNSTNNDSEIRAIYLGINMILNYLNICGVDKIPQTINLFSDSQICVKGLTEWIYSWIRCIHNGEMYSSSGQPVANQEIIKAIVLAIQLNKINLNIIHQKGHVTSTKKSLDHALAVFRKSNNIKSHVDINLIIEISKFNNHVDLITKENLDYYDKLGYFNQKYMTLEKAITMSTDSINIKEYHNLIKGRIK